MDIIVVKDWIINIRDDEFISLTDIARYNNSKEPRYVIQNWIRNHDTISFLGLWEFMNNKSFKRVEFDAFRNNSGANSFSLSAEEWIEKTNATGIKVKRGRHGGGTYAHKDIAFVKLNEMAKSQIKILLDNNKNIKVTGK